MLRKAFVRIYCEIPGDEFPDDGFTDGKLVTGDEIYNFLTKSMGRIIDSETNKPIPGDYVIWYLGSAEKCGILHVNEIIVEWNYGESNWDRVLLFLRILNDIGVLSVGQYVSLISFVEEGMNNFDDIDQIPAYLKAKFRALTRTKIQGTITDRIINSMNSPK